MDQLRRLQLTELEILKWFDGFCSQNGLEYYIVAGTLLGAVRHKGFIPWDDDVDVAMPRADFMRMEALFEKEPPEGLFYQCHATEPNYVFGFSKLRKPGTLVWEEYLEPVEMEKGVYIDIFPLDPCPRGFCGKLMFKAVELISCALMSRSGMDFTCGYTKWYMRLLYGLLRKLKIARLISLRDKVIGFFGRHSGASPLLATVHGCHGYPNETYEPSWLGGGKRLDFEDAAFVGPKMPEKALENMFGDYMTPPEQRGGHFDMDNTRL